jgi:hypothetical protein
VSATPPKALSADREQPGHHEVEQRAHNRWLVHLGLLATFIAALASVTVYQTSLTIHIILGLAFVGLAAVHIAQRRQTVGRLATQLTHARGWFKPRGRLAISDVILFLLTLNVLVSGVVDWVRGYKAALPIEAVTGLHVRFIGWHVFSAIVLLCYLLVHVIRRRGRLRHSRIR